MTSPFLFMSVLSGVASCMAVILLAYNAIALIMFMREDSEGSASGMAKGAWAMGIVALFTAGLPCMGSIVPFVAIILSRVEKGRIYRDEAALAGATPVRLAAINGWIALMISLLVLLGVVLSGVSAYTAPTVG